MVFGNLVGTPVKLLLRTGCVLLAGVQPDVLSRYPIDGKDNTEALHLAGLPRRNELYRLRTG